MVTPQDKMCHHKTMEEIKTIFKNPMKLNIACKSKFRKEDIYKCAITELGWYRRSTMKVVNFT